MNLRNIIDSIGGRKLVIALGLFATSTALLIMGVGAVDFSQWADFQAWNFGIYAFGNGISKGADAYKVAKAKTGEI